MASDHQIVMISQVLPEMTCAPLLEANFESPAEMDFGIRRKHVDKHRLQNHYQVPSIQQVLPNRGQLSVPNLLNHHYNQPLGCQVTLVLVQTERQPHLLRMKRRFVNWLASLVMARCSTEVRMGHPIPRDPALQHQL